jgi:hypothetical protein
MEHEQWEDEMVGKIDLVGYSLEILEVKILGLEDEMEGLVLTRVV